MLSFNKKFMVYNYMHTAVNSYRFITMHRTLKCINSKDLFNISKMVLSYVSPSMADFNNISVLGSFLVIKLLTEQFPYVSKYNLVSTFNENTHQLIIAASLNKANIGRFINWFFIQFYNPITFYNPQIVSKGIDHLSVNLTSYNLIKQLSVHPVFFKWTETLNLKISYNQNVDIYAMLKLVNKKL